MHRLRSWPLDLQTFQVIWTKMDATHKPDPNYRYLENDLNLLCNGICKTKQPYKISIFPLGTRNSEISLYLCRYSLHIQRNPATLEYPETLSYSQVTRQHCETYWAWPHITPPFNSHALPPEFSNVPPYGQWLRQHGHATTASGAAFRGQSSQWFEGLYSEQATSGSHMSGSFIRWWPQRKAHDGSGLPSL